MTDEQAASRLGSVVGKYTLARIIGSGGMATVYEAHHRNGHRVAVKMLKPSLSVGKDVRTRFLREGYAANRVKHVGAVRILDDEVSDDGLVFLVMELLEGWTIDGLAKKREDRRLSLELVAAVGTQLLDVLAAAHEAGVIHRDIKPENVFVQKNGELKVLDFGIARIADPDAPATSTATGRMLGTPAFMPPEQAYGRRTEIDARSDLWSAGATLFTALLGRVVHLASTAEETLIKAATESAPSLADLSPDIPHSISAVIDRALLSDKELRWQSAIEMRDALKGAYREAFGHDPPKTVDVGDEARGADAAATMVAERPNGVSTTLTTPTRRALRWVAPLAAVALVIGGALAADRHPHSAPPKEVDAREPKPEPEGSVKEVQTPASAAPLPPLASVVAQPQPVERRLIPARKSTPIAPAATVSGSSSSSTSTPSAKPASSGVCGYDFDEEGRKWPRRCNP